MSELAFASITQLHELLSKKEISPHELAEYFRARFMRFDPVIKSALEVFDLPPESFRLRQGFVGQVDTADVLSPLVSSVFEFEKLKNVSRDESVAQCMLWGIPGLVKDNICQKDRLTTAASKILAGYKAPYNATAVERLNVVGAYSLGRANCDEFAMGSTGEYSAYQRTVNPWDTARVPGGSSSGSAAAVAAGLVPWALGSETGGSVRQPSFFCGLVGLKPTYGLVSRYGLIPYSSSMDQIGIFTRNVRDNAIVLETIAGRDSRDSTSRAAPSNDYTSKLNGALPKGLTIGVVENALEQPGFDSEVTAALNNALTEYEVLGARIRRIKLPVMEHATAVYFMISRAEAASNLARYDGVRYGLRAESDDLIDMYIKTRSEGFGHAVKQRIMVGNYALSAGHADAFYRSAKRVQASMRDEFLKTFEGVDVLFAPVSPIPAFKFGEVAGFELDLMDYFTASINLAGLPGLAVPCGFTKSGLPVGFQLWGPDFSEALLYSVGDAYQQRTAWHTMHPEWLK